MAILLVLLQLGFGNHQILPRTAACVHGPLVMLQLTRRCRFIRLVKCLLPLLQTVVLRSSLHTPLTRDRRHRLVCRNLSNPLSSKRHQWDVAQTAITSSRCLLIWKRHSTKSTLTLFLLLKCQSNHKRPGSIQVVVLDT